MIQAGAKDTTTDQQSQSEDAAKPANESEKSDKEGESEPAKNESQE